MATQQIDALGITEEDVKEFPGGVTPDAVSITMTLRHTPTIGKLAEALAKASLEFPEITKDTENPYFKSQYADLATLIKATRSPLAKHALVVMQFPQLRPNKALLTTMLCHSSGEWIAADLEMPLTKGDAQGVGSGITYGRRYSYQSILNIAGEEDDDGNAAAGRTQEDRSSKGATEKGGGRINPVQLRALQSACTTGGKSQADLLKYLGNMGYESPDELTKPELDAAIKWALAKG